MSRDISSQDIYCPGTICRRDNMSPYVPIILLFKGATYCPRRHIVPVRKGDILSRETYCPGWQQMVTLGNKCMKGYYGFYDYYGLQTNCTEDKSYGLFFALICLGQTVRRQIVRTALIRGGQIVRIGQTVRRTNRTDCISWCCWCCC